MAPRTLEAESVLGLCSGHTQYSAQSPQRTARGRNTTPLSHLADVPVLLYSLPHFSPLPLLSLYFSLAQYPTRVLYEWADGECFCMCAVQMRGLLLCVSVREREKEMKRMQGMEENKDKYTGKRSSREGETDGEKLGPASEYNQFSYEPWFPSAPPQQPTSIVFVCEGKAGNEAFTHRGSILQTSKCTYTSLNHWRHLQICNSINCRLP